MIKKTSFLILAGFLFLFFHCINAGAQEDVKVEMFSPEGAVKGVRQVSVRFSEQMVPFGDPRLVEPFEIKCPSAGHQRWADGKNWIYDFDNDLPAGVVCEFTLKPDLKSLSGKPVTGNRKFAFSTGGPAIKNADPHEGSKTIAEDQIFVLTLDAEPVEESVLSNVFCAIAGINEKVGIRILKGEERDRLLNLRYHDRFRDTPHLVVQCRQQFPNNTRVDLVWGKGIAAISGVQTTEDQKLSFKSRSPFTFHFSCSRENKTSDCIPILPMYLKFSSPVSWETAQEIVLKGKSKRYKPEKFSRYDYDEYNESEGEGGYEIPDDENFVYGISFKGPFPEKSSFVIELPGEIIDDAGRKLSNKDKFPLTVRTDAFPPLAKFAARFGIIELKGDAALPVTLRNIEPELKTRKLKAEENKDSMDQTKEMLLENAVKAGEAVNSILPDSMRKKGNEFVEGLKGRLHKLKMDKEEKIIEMLKQLASAQREHSILRDEHQPEEFKVPRPEGSKPFEVVGIPLKESGFYIVEMESRILGESLLGKKDPMYVPAGALVTNLSAHFKWGRESSLVWVTSLDKAEPVKDAYVSIRDCKGKLVWKGETDSNGVALIKTTLPSERELPYCGANVNYSEASSSLNSINRGLFVFAKTSDDLTFVHSSWDDGIDPWRFNLPYDSNHKPIIAHTIFDRTLLRAGETIHMKHIVRKHSMPGFLMIKEADYPNTILIRHQGSEQRYEFSLKWDNKGIAETTWEIPKEAKLGHYSVSFMKKKDKPKQRTAVGGYGAGDEEYYCRDCMYSGTFRVEEFRIPLMKAIIQPPKEPLVKATETEVDLMVSYLSGGGAGNLPVMLRSMIQPKYVSFDNYEDFTFANGSVKEEIIRRSSYEEDQLRGENRKPKLITSDLELDISGGLRAKISGIPEAVTPVEILSELEFNDPSGERQTVSQRIPLWPSKVIIGIKPDSWASSRESFKFHTVVLDLSGKPVKDAEVKAELFRRRYFSHRKRLVGGFYSYEHVTEIKRIGPLCEGKTDAKGLLICEGKSPASGNVIVQASTADGSGNKSVANRDVWIAGKDEWWFDVSDNDRIDLLPEKKKYEPGETAKFQVRMPFRNATALVSIEREGVIETFIKKLSGKEPVIEIPVKKNYAPNVFISALLVRGRVSGVQPTAMVDLGKPAFKLGIAEINVGWKAHELKVNVSAEKTTYKIREKAKVHIKVRKADGALPPRGSEVAVAAVDEGLLELMPNNSWKLLEAMMGRRSYEIRTSTAQMQVVGKRHFGLKALPQGGGGGSSATRELFNALLFWKARIPLNDKGEAKIEVPLNDSLTGFRIVAVASGGTGMFGTGQTEIRTTQDIMVLSGVPHLVREGDLFKAGFTIRNASNRKMDITLSAKTTGLHDPVLEDIFETLSAGEAKEAGWMIKAPYGADRINYEVSVAEKNGNAQDIIKIKQKIVEAVPSGILQATLTQVEDKLGIDIERPKDAVQGKGGINVSFRSKLSNGLGGVTWYMNRYPYTCMEQKVSKAVALRDEVLWKKVTEELPSHLDSDGLVKYFPSCIRGDDTLTSYILSISHEAGYAIPDHIREKMENGLRGFIEGRIMRYSSLPTADLSIRKIAAVESLSRYNKAEPRLLDSIAIEPNLWPTSAVLDWMNLLMRLNAIPDSNKKKNEAEQILRSRMNFQGTTMGFSTEGMDNLWWLMVSSDVNAVKSVLTFLSLDSWNQDMPRLVRGALGRQYKGHWNITTANAWGVLAMEKFSKKFESMPVTGETSGILNDKTKTVEWNKTSEGGSVFFDWPKERKSLSISHQGAGKPWATVQSIAAVPLKEPFSSGYKIKKAIKPVEQKAEGRWTRGDIARVRLELEAQADMTWVVVNDPIPSGSNILGTGLGRDSQILTAGEKREGWVWPVFEERSFEAFRAYYEFVPKGKWIVEYTIRLNNSGDFLLPPTRAEALYSPEMFGEMPNKSIKVEPYSE